MPEEIVVLYDGWPLVRTPNSPESVHLAALLALHPEGIRACLALPGVAPTDLPPAAETFVIEMGGDETDRMAWEQVRLPGIARHLQAHWLHQSSGYPALFRPVRSLLTPGSEPGQPAVHQAGGLAMRLRSSLGQGGLARGGLILWPADLPAPGWPHVRLAPPAVHPAFGPNPYPAAGMPSSLEVPESYVLYNGPPSGQSLRQLLEAWSWAAGSIGEHTPLLLVGVSPALQETLAGLAAEYGFDKTVRALPPVSIENLAGLYRGCAAVFHPSPPAPWSSALRLGLACARPVVALETRLADAMAGPAAYLVPPGGSRRDQARRFGAALITVIVEESVSQALSAAALQRSETWDRQQFRKALQEVYRS